MKVAQAGAAQQDAGQANSPPRGWPLALGLGVLAGAWLGPLPTWAPKAFVAHMLMHVTVVAVAAPLLALAFAGRACDPARRWPWWFAALPASFVELVVVWAWHTPALHGAARSGGGALAAEQLMFLFAAFWVWMAALGGAARERRAAGIGALLMTSMHMTLLGALLAVAPRLLYAHAHSEALGLTPLGDQHWGGVIMLLGGGSAYLLGGLYLLWGLLSPDRSANGRS